MPTQPKPKPRPVGRPKLAKGQAKGKIVPVRLGPYELIAFDRAAKAKNMTRSEWIRETLNAATF